MASKKKCPECGDAITAASATACPKCGHKLRKRGIMIYVMMALLLMMLAGGIALYRFWSQPMDPHLKLDLTPKPAMGLSLRPLF